MIPPVVHRRASNGFSISSSSAARACPSHAIPRANKVEERAVGRHARARRALTVVAKSWSRLTHGGLPEFALLRNAQFLAGPFAAVAGETIEMPPRAALRNGVFPACFEPAPLIKAHE